MKGGGNSRRKGGIAMSLCSPSPALGWCETAASLHPARSIFSFRSPPAAAAACLPARTPGEPFPGHRGELVYQLYLSFQWLCWQGRPHGPRTGPARPDPVAAAPGALRAPLGGRRCSAATRRERAGALLLCLCVCVPFAALSRKPREQLRLVNNADNLSVSLCGAGVLDSCIFHILYCVSA